jgi:polysaccharide export outer membrane protein
MALGLAAPLHGQGNPPVGPGDTVAIIVFGEPTLTGDYNVDADGTFEFPLIGRVPAVGLTAREVEAELVTRLANGFLNDPQVTVSLQQLANVQIFVMGEVGTPGAYQFTEGVTLLEALARAGSTSPSAQEVLVVRGGGVGVAGPSLPGADDGREVVRLDLRLLQAGVLGRSNMTLRHGDTVFVPRAQSVYITGQVRSPGAYNIQPGTTVLQALSLAGGATDRGATGRIRILREADSEGEDGENAEPAAPLEIRVELTDPVQPGDTIIVPERFF